MTIKKLYNQTPFNHFWQFMKLPLLSEMSDIFKNEHLFEDVTLPHDWAIKTTDDFYKSSIGWYKKNFNLKLDKETFYSLLFEAVYMDTIIYINRVKAFEWKYGYTSFNVDITPYILDGDNEIIVRVNYECPNSRWYSGAGIYRDVHLIKKHKNSFLHDSIYTYYDFVDNDVLLTIESDMSLDKTLFLTHQIQTDSDLKDKSTVIVSKTHNKMKILIKEPKLWSMDNPFLYTLKSTLYEDSTIYDEVVQKIGFRKIKTDPNDGLTLNGQSIKLNGVCEHHDLGALGAAFHRETLKNRLILLKSMGVNAIRTGHSIPAKALMELADEMGFLISSDAFDVWRRPKTTHDYARFFDEWIEKDIKSWVMRDRNHASLLMWSIGNEIYDTHVDSDGVNLTKKILKLIRLYDKEENAFVTIGSNFLMGNHAQASMNVLKYAGYNYAENLYHTQHEKYPDWIIYGSETASIVQSRGIYHFPLSEYILMDDDKQCSSLGNSVTSWGAKSYEFVTSFDKTVPYSLGQFIWTGFDYIGEPTPYDTKNSYFGQIDTAGFPKDSFYVYQAAWHDYKIKPVLHIFPYWSFNEGEMIDVRIATNLPFIKLYLNEKFIGECQTKHDLIPTFRIPFTKGQLKAVGYDENNQEILVCEKRSFDDPKHVFLTVSKDYMNADGIDITEIVVELLDKDYILVDNANSEVSADITGPGVILGMDQGDSTDFTTYKTNQKRMFSGKLKIFIGSTLKSGQIKLNVHVKGVGEKEITILTLPTELNDEATRAQEMNHLVRSHEFKISGKVNDFIPIRQIELIAGNKILTSENCEVLVKYKILPDTATIKDLNCKIVNIKGIETSLAKAKITDQGILVTAVGDGEFILKVTSNNLKEHADITSTILFRSEGLGIAYKNPYELIIAGLYDKSTNNLKSGNEQGVATPNEKSYIYFNNIDFSALGSKKITLPIFSFDTKEVNVDMYEVDMNDKKIYIETFKYLKPTIWNVYQEESYELKTPLRGIKNLVFEFNTAVHFKGFKFEKITPYEDISILMCDTYYGDSFIKTEDAFKHIGNNVTFGFERLELTKESSKIVVQGLSNTKSNTIRLIFTDETGKTDIEHLEFEKTDIYVKQTFNIKKRKGIFKLEFVFLPGSDFDFKTFKFE